MKTRAIRLLRIAAASMALVSFAAAPAGDREPAVVTPGTAGSPPSDAVVLFDGKDLSAWKSDDGSEPKWKLENGHMEVRGTVKGVTVYDDFAHHPTAIRTTVDGLRRQVGTARILAVFEPRSNTMKLGTMKSQLPWSLEEANLAICHSGGLDWDAREALAEMGARAQVGHTVDEVIAQVVAAAQGGDHVLCMSNGGFGGIHAKLLKALG